MAIGLALGLLVLADCGGGGEAENLSTATTRDNSVSPTTAQGLLTLRVTVIGTDQEAAVTSEPPGISCPGSCTASLLPAQVALTARGEVDGSFFDHWEARACAFANDLTCDFLLDTDTDITAVYTPATTST